MSPNSFNQIATVTSMNVRNISRRWGSSSVAVVGVACVVGVFIGVLSMAAGFQRTMLNADSPDSLLFMRAGATSEMSSGLSQEQTQLIGALPAIALDGGQKLTSAELFVVADLSKKDSATPANVTLRGVQDAAFKVRDGVKLRAGRRFQSGTNELIVGIGAERQFANLTLGSKVKLGQAEWTVVGTFEARGGLAESELWCNDKALQAAYRRGNSYQSVRARMSGADALPRIKAAMQADLGLAGIDVRRESDYLAEQSAPLTSLIVSVGYPLAVVMALGAIFGAINTMYTSVSMRTREIATLRALGFGRLPVVVSTVAESLVLALAGSVIGAAVAYLVFNGYTVSTLNSASFSQVVFDFAVTPALVEKGVVMALIIGLFGALFPAMRAVRLPVAAALRER
jgi:putative ABC transport system permease protein